MNITDLIVDLLQQGKTVEIPGIGTLRTEMQAAHHDPRTHTYYPARRVVVYSNLQNDSRELIANIARKECVSEDIAEMMLKNYIGALESKLQREGCHTFANIGTLTKDESGFGFNPDDNFGIEKNTAAEKPIEHINTYTPKKADPFAAFERPAPVVETPKEEVAMPEPIVEEPKPVVEEPVKVAEPTPEPVAIEKAEPEKVADPESAKEPEPVKVVEPEPVKEEPRPIEEETTPAEPTVEAKDEGTNELLQQLENIPEAPKTVEEGERKKKKGWLWILLVLLLLLIGAGAYYYFVYMPSQQPSPIMSQVEDTIVPQPETLDTLPIEDTTAFNAEEDSLAVSEDDTTATAVAEEVEEAEPVAADAVKRQNFTENANIFTFSTEQIGYTPEEIAELSKHVRNYMNDYLDSYLSAEGYPTAKEVMMDSVESYANQRLGELLDNNKYCVQNFIPNHDYIHNYIENGLKANKANHACVKVQTEIMDANYLAPKLNSIIDALQLAPAAVAAPKTSAPKAATKQAEPNYSNVNFASQSKKGFDIIAGFFKNKNGAAKLTQSLKAQGCDAYVISTSNGHYVSMGSTSNRTQADAMYKHIKSWYSGDVVIKQW